MVNLKAPSDENMNAPHLQHNRKMSNQEKKQEEEPIKKEEELEEKKEEKQLTNEKVLCGGCSCDCPDFGVGGCCGHVCTECREAGKWTEQEEEQEIYHCDYDDEFPTEDELEEYRYQKWLARMEQREEKGGCYY